MSNFLVMQLHYLLIPYFQLFVIHFYLGPGRMLLQLLFCFPTGYCSGALRGHDVKFHVNVHVLL